MIWLPKGGSQQKDGRLYSRKCATNPLAIFESIRRQSTKNLKKKRETHNYSARRQRRRRRRHAVENKRRTVERNERCLVFAVFFHDCRRETMKIRCLLGPLGQFHWVAAVGDYSFGILRLLFYSAPSFYFNENRPFISLFYLFLLYTIHLHVVVNVEKTNKTSCRSAIQII